MGVEAATRNALIVGALAFIAGVASSQLLGHAGRWQVVNLGRIGVQQDLADAMLVDTTTGKTFRFNDVRTSVRLARSGLSPEQLAEVEARIKELPPPSDLWMPVKSVDESTQGSNAREAGRNR